MPLQDELRRWAQRILLSLGSAVAVSATAFVCAWIDYRYQDHGQPTLWEFTTVVAPIGTRNSCLLAGALTFPLCLLYSTGWDGTRSSLVKVLIANSVTAIFAILAAVVMAALYMLPFEEHH
jgi:uncharacterized BrkB/YihY/UPF0761 family membrane protein